MLRLRPAISLVALVGTLLHGCSTEKVKVKPCTIQNYSPAQIFKQTAPSIVVIKSSNSQGSGFVVKQDESKTYILTNSHVVDGAEEVTIKWSDERSEKARVISDHGGDPLQKDLALLQVDEIRGKPLELKQNPPSIGDDVVAIGAPQGLEFSLSRGVLSQVRDKGDFLQIDAAINPGNSGGPLFDKTGCVIGVNTFKAQESEGLNFAIGYPPVKYFLGNPSIVKSKGNSSSKSKEDWVTYLHIYSSPSAQLSLAQLSPASIKPQPPFILYSTRRAGIDGSEKVFGIPGTLRSKGVNCNQELIRYWGNSDSPTTKDFKRINGYWALLRNGRLEQYYPELEDVYKRMDYEFTAVCSIIRTGNISALRPATYTNKLP